MKLTKLKTDYTKIQKKYRKTKQQIDKNNKGPKANSQPNSLNSSFKSDIGGGGGVSAAIVDDQHQQIISLKSQLNEHKLKEMQLFHEKENLSTNYEHLNKINSVST